MRRPTFAFLLAPLAVALAGCASTSTSGGTTPPTTGTTVGSATTPAAARGEGLDVARMAASRPTGTTFVVLVRHAEKGTAPANDPPLSAEGTARAQALAARLADVPVTAVIVTPTRRTNETAAAVAQARGLTPEAVAISGEHVNAVASAVRRNAGGVVLVVGHSNTIPAIINALGGPRLPDLCDTQYSQLFVLQLPPDGGLPRLARDVYGSGDAATAENCPTMR